MGDIIACIAVCAFCAGVGLIVGAGWGTQKARTKDNNDTLRSVWEAGAMNVLNCLLSERVISEEQHTQYTKRFLVKFRGGSK